MTSFDYKKLFATAGIFTIGGLHLAAINAKDNSEEKENNIFQMFSTNEASTPTPEPTPEP